MAENSDVVEDVIAESSGNTTRSLISQHQPNGRGGIGSALLVAL